MTRGARLGMGSKGISEAGRARVNEIQRARLVAAMVQVSSDRGLAGATIARVVARAGVSRRTFYELFEDRGECFLAGFDGSVAQASRYVLDSYDPKAGWAERLRTALAGLLSFLTYERGAAQLLIVGSLGAGPRALERRRRVLAQIIVFVDEGRTLTKAGSELPPLTAEGVVGGALSVIHARMVEVPPARARSRQLADLLNPLMSMIVLPYLGPVAARKELSRCGHGPRPLSRRRAGGDLLADLEMRLTYRTVRVLMAVAAQPGSSNRAIGEAGGMIDQGQTSKLLSRLERLGLIRNNGIEPGKGGPNVWVLTEKGAQVEQVMRGNTEGQPITTSTRSRR